MSQPVQSEGAIERIVFFGTPEFAVPTLDALIEAGRAPVLVVSQPARPVGRGRQLSQPPVAERAAEHGLPLLQPHRLRGEALEAIAAAAPDLAVVVAFGKIFSRRLLELPTHGCLNLHASLLPRHRGAAPIQAAIAAGDRVTGVATMRMEASLDTGPVYLVEEIEIGPDETTPELAPRLAAAGARLVVETVAALEAGTLEATPQDHDRATYAGRIEKADGRVDWRQPARSIYDRWRAFQPWPGLTASLRGEPVKLVACRPLVRSTTPSIERSGRGSDQGVNLGVEGGAAEETSGERAGAAAPASRGASRESGNGDRPAGDAVGGSAGRLGRGPAGPPPGTLFEIADGGLHVACGGGSALALTRLQRPGRKALAGDLFARGERLGAGERFDPAGGER